MNARRRSRSSEVAAHAGAGHVGVATAVARVRPWCLAACAALLVARPLWPSDVATLSGAGIPAALGWLLLAAVWLLAGLRDRALRVHWLRIDAALGALLLLIAASGLLAVYRAAPRAAANVTWEWMGLIACFWLVRQLLRTPREARALIVVMIGLAAAEAGYALHQYFVSLPADRAAYLADPDGMLRANGLWFPPGSRERYLFEQRLASTEPFGTFELANSLAGLLAAWLVAACAAPWGSPAGRTAPAPTGLVAALATAALLGAALVLTKSRSAWIAAAAGMAAIAVVVVAQSFGARRRAWFVAGSAAALIAGGLTFGWMAGAIDAEVFSEIPKSFAYRWQYWQASMGIVRQHPVLGCGPGNFRDAYTEHKLPEASEEVADPHNFVLEVAATAGIPAAAALMIALGGLLFIGVRRLLASPQNGASAVEVDDRLAAADGAASADRHVLAGAVAGFLFAFLLPMALGPMIPVALSLAKLLGGLAALGIVTLLWRSWIVRGALSVLTPLAGAAALLVHLLAAGGIGFPATAGSLWLLLALVAWLGRPVELALSIAARRVLAPAVLIVCLAAALCYWTAYKPVADSQRLQAEAEFLPRQAEQKLLEATAADPWDADPWAKLASWRFAQWKAQPDAARWQGVEEAVAAMLRLRPRQSAAWSAAGDYYVAAGERMHDASLLSQGVDAYRRAVERYPRQAVRRAKLALALEKQGDLSAARQEAEQALSLDQLTPHFDQKLPAPLRSEVERVLRREPM